MEQATLKKDILKYLCLGGAVGSTLDYTSIKNVSPGSDGYYTNGNPIHIPQNVNHVYEIRIRSGRPVMFCEFKRDWFLDNKGNLTQMGKDLYIATSEDIAATLQILSSHSLYAYREDICNGFLTIRGGHRIGIVGKTVLENGGIKNLTDFSGLNIRVAKSIPGCSNEIMKYIVDRNGMPNNTLILSPPACGKTTILRDISRNLSNGSLKLGLSGIKVGIVDERSEIASVYRGTPTHDVGIRTDVLDGCPKASGIGMLLRSMSPQVIITDELGGQEDIIAIKKSINAGIKMITTFHGYGIDELRHSGGRGDILKEGLFERIVVLNFKNGPGSLACVYSGRELKELQVNLN